MHRCLGHLKYYGYCNTLLFMVLWFQSIMGTVTIFFSHLPVLLWMRCIRVVAFLSASLICIWDYHTRCQMVWSSRAHLHFVSLFTQYLIQIYTHSCSLWQCNVSTVQNSRHVLPIFKLKTHLLYSSATWICNIFCEPTMYLLPKCGCSLECPAPIYSCHNSRYSCLPQHSVLGASSGFPAFQEPSYVWDAASRLRCLLLGQVWVSLVNLELKVQDSRHWVQSSVCFSKILICPY